MVGALNMITAKKAGLGLLNPLTSAQEKYLLSHRGEGGTGSGHDGGKGILQY